MSTNQAPQNDESQNVARIEWDGEGLPPAGTVCEQQTWVNREWRIVEVVAHFNKFAVCAWEESPDDNQVELAPPGDLRPIRTPEQVAADEREHDIRNACTAISTTLSELHESEEPTAVAIIEAMIDAGYRKP